jgi:hypothetical protein
MLDGGRAKDRSVARWWARRRVAHRHDTAGKVTLDRSGAELEGHLLSQSLDELLELATLLEREAQRSAAAEAVYRRCCVGRSLVVAGDCSGGQLEV